MAIIKLTTWNIEHFGKMLPDPQQKSTERLKAVANEIEEIGPNILCVVEGPGNLPALLEWAASEDGLSGQYRVATISGTDEILQQNPPKPA